MRCEQEIAVGAYLLDALEPDEQLRMREHVERCEVCAQSVRELSGVSGLLAGVEMTSLELSEERPPAPQPSEFAYQRLRSAAAAPLPPAAAPVTASRRRSGRMLAAAAAAVIVLGGVAVGGVVALSSSAPAPTTLTAQASGISAHAKIVASGSGSLVTLTLDGVPLGERCRLVAVGRDGYRSSTHMWAITRPGALSWTDSVDVAPRDLDHLEVVTDDGRTLVTLPA